MQDPPISESVLMVYMEGDADTQSLPEPDISKREDSMTHEHSILVMHKK